MRVLPFALCLVLAVMPPARAADPRRAGVRINEVTSGLSEPLGITAANDSSSRLFVVERPGRIRVIRSGLLRTKPFLDITGKVSTSGERGLLSVAFSPNYKVTGNFYVSYVDTGGTLRISRFHATPGSDVASTRETVLLSVSHPTYTNHYGGQVAFGPSNLLYISTGDGGGSGDPNGNAQNLRSLLGKVLRINAGKACGSLKYCIPSTNPFASSSTTRREIWLYGLRNPWRLSFDRANNDLWIGDVGQSTYEEVDHLPGTTGGRNLGWDCREGNLNTVSKYGGSYCSGRTFTAPVWTYGRSSGCAIIGGYVYRGSRWRTLLDGVYIYGDYCDGHIWGLARDSAGRWVNALLYGNAGQILTFGQDLAGEVYLGTAAGKVFRISAYRR